jgi:hypothetical protein
MPSLPHNQADRETVESFIGCLFKYADKERYISLRAFHDLKDHEPPLFIEGVKVGAPDLIDRICIRITEAATNPEPYVFCPPVCTFNNPTGAKVADLAEGIALSVECDANPRAAYSKLVALLGTPTATVASGGIWTNGDGKPEPKLHLHWRLVEPTRTPEAHEQLRKLRVLAARLVGADTSNITIVHPIRMAGSWHRKVRPVLSRLKAEPDREIDLAEGLDLLQAACPEPERPRRTNGGHPPGSDDEQRARDAIRYIPADDRETWLRMGMALHSTGWSSAFAIWENWSRSSGKYDERDQEKTWRSFQDRSNGVTIATLFHEAQQYGYGRERSAKSESRSGANSGHGESDRWDDPDWSLLDDRRGDLPEFPLDTLTAKARAWVVRAADGAGVTAAHVAVPALGVASSLIGTARRLQASTSWLQPMTCWVAVVGFSGTGKTPGLDATRGALANMQRDNRGKIDQLQRQHESKVESAKAAREKWKKAVEEATEKGKPAPIMPIEATAPGKFIAPRLYVADGTIERFGELLQARPQGMLRLSDELSGMFMNMSRYSGGQDNEFWLEAWNGKSYNVERIGRTLQIDHLLIGVVGGMQPEKLAESFKGAADGMYARFLFSWPPEPRYTPLTDEAMEVDPDIQNALGRLDRLAEFADGNLIVRSIPLSDDARRGFEQFRQFAHRGKDALEGREREWWAKMPGHVLRLAGTLCLFDWAMSESTEPPTTVGAGYMESAVRLVRDYFWPHARAALRQIGLSDRHVNARRALRWIREHGREWVSREDIRRDALGQKLDAEATEHLLGGLVRAGFLRRMAAPSGPKGGKPAIRWMINPALQPSTAETAETAETDKLEVFAA